MRGVQIKEGPERRFATPLRPFYLYIFQANTLFCRITETHEMFVTKLAKSLVETIHYCGKLEGSDWFEEETKLPQVKA